MPHDDHYATWRLWRTMNMYCATVLYIMSLVILVLVPLHPSPPFRVGILCFPSECLAWSLLKVLLTHVSLSSLVSSASHHNSSNPSHQHNRFNMHMNMNHHHNMYTTYAHDNTITRGHMIAIAVLFVIWCP